MNYEFRLVRGLGVGVNFGWETPKLTTKINVQLLCKILTLGSVKDLLLLLLVLRLWLLEYVAPTLVSDLVTNRYFTPGNVLLANCVLLLWCPSHRPHLDASLLISGNGVDGKVSLYIRVGKKNSAVSNHPSPWFNSQLQP